MTTPLAPQGADEPILFERIARHIARVTLNRPQARNAVNVAMTLRLEEVVRSIEADPELRVAILAAAPGPAFCAGADLAEVAAGRGPSLVTREGGFAGFVYATRHKPWIAAVHGFVLGGGLEFALACDMVVAAQDAVFGLPEPKRGLLAAAGGAYRLPRAVPRAIALEMLSTGATLDAQRAHALGLVNRVVDLAALPEAALALAAQVVANEPLSVRESLAIGRAAAELDEAALRRLSAEATARVMASEDAREGPRAFVEKRAPVWRT
ncbi:MAG TPA: enoyl-CoA hydratase-related protein [Burkholderiaceae bacterium]|nr:enoyl-CoA hydratase-related protein [Burkholderiaceae bacterium]